MLLIDFHFRPPRQDFLTPDIGFGRRGIDSILAAGDGLSRLRRIYGCFLLRRRHPAEPECSTLMLVLFRRGPFFPVLSPGEMPVQG